MKIYKGNTGLSEFWQNSFKENISCKKCGANARIMLVAIEKEKEDMGDKAIYVIYENNKDGKYWPHDYIAVAVHLCEKCFEANIETAKEEENDAWLSRKRCSICGVEMKPKITTDACDKCYKQN